MLMETVSEHADHSSLLFRVTDSDNNTALAVNAWDTVEVRQRLQFGYMIYVLIHHTSTGV